VYNLKDINRNDTDKAKLKYSEKNLSQCHVSQHKCHIGCPGIESRLPR
jgi:hypothetical protein